MAIERGDLEQPDQVPTSGSKFAASSTFAALAASSDEPADDDDLGAEHGTWFIDCKREKTFRPAEARSVAAAARAGWPSENWRTEQIAELGHTSARRRLGRPSNASRIAQVQRNLGRIGLVLPGGQRRALLTLGRWVSNTSTFAITSAGTEGRPRHAAPGRMAGVVETASADFNAIGDEAAV